MNKQVKISNVISAGRYEIEFVFEINKTFYRMNIDRLPRKKEWNVRYIWIFTGNDVKGVYEHSEFIEILSQNEFLLKYTKGAKINARFDKDYGQQLKRQEELHAEFFRMKEK